MKATIILFPNESKKSRRNNKIPIYMRIIFKGLKSETRLNVEMTDQELLKWNPITMRIQERNSALNHYLNRIEQKFQDFIITNSTELGNYSASYMRNYVLGINVQKQVSVMNFVDDYF